jgi:hypothetical protein
MADEPPRRTLLSMASQLLHRAELHAPALHAPAASQGRPGEPGHTVGHVLDPDPLGDHLDRLFRAAWALCGSREEAEDLVQDAYAHVLARPRLVRNDDDLGYLLRVLRNTFISHRRAAARRPHNADIELEALAVPDPRHRRSTGCRPDARAVRRNRKGEPGRGRARPANRLRASRRPVSREERGSRALRNAGPRPGRTHPPRSAERVLAPAS